MNVYSVHFIPRLKIKLCEFLGAASTLAFRELYKRLEQLEFRLDRFESQLRRMHRRQMALEAAQKSIATASAAEKRAPRKAQPKKESPLRKTTRKLRPELFKKEVQSNKVTPIPAPKQIHRAEAAEPLPSATVLMIKPEPEVEKVVQEYFGKETRIQILQEVAKLEAALRETEVSVVFFERSSLGDSEERRVLEDLKSFHPQTKFVGLSNYLTLALAQSMSGEENFDTFLTRPLSLEALAGVFEKKGAALTS